MVRYRRHLVSLKIPGQLEFFDCDYSDTPSANEKGHSQPWSARFLGTLPDDDLLMPSRFQPGRISEGTHACLFLTLNSCGDAMHCWIPEPLGDVAPTRFGSMTGREI